MFYLQGKADESAQGFSLEADDYEYNDKNQTITATNDATLKGNGIFLNANRILWDKKSNLVQPGFPWTYLKHDDGTYFHHLFLYIYILFH